MKLKRKYSVPLSLIAFSGQCNKWEQFFWRKNPYNLLYCYWKCKGSKAVFDIVDESKYFHRKFVEKERDKEKKMPLELTDSLQKEVLKIQNHVKWLIIPNWENNLLNRKKLRFVKRRFIIKTNNDNQIKKKLNLATSVENAISVSKTSAFPINSY